MTANYFMRAANESPLLGSLLLVQSPLAVMTPLVYSHHLFATTVCFKGVTNMDTGDAAGDVMFGKAYHNSINSAQNTWTCHALCDGFNGLAAHRFACAMR